MYMTEKENILFIANVNSTILVQMSTMFYGHQDPLKHILNGFCVWNGPTSQFHFFKQFICIFQTKRRLRRSLSKYYKLDVRGANVKLSHLNTSSCIIVVARLGRVELHILIFYSSLIIFYACCVVTFNYRTKLLLFSTDRVFVVK